MFVVAALLTTRRKEARATPFAKSPHSLPKWLNVSLDILILYRLLLGPHVRISYGSQSSGLKSRCLGSSYTATCCLGCIWSARSWLWILLCAASAQSGLLSKPQQICGEETRCHHPGKNQVLFLLRRLFFVCVVAEWSAYPPIGLFTRVRFLLPLVFSFFLSPRPRR